MDIERRHRSDSTGPSDGFEQGLDPADVKASFSPPESSAVCLVAVLLSCLQLANFLHHHHPHTSLSFKSDPKCALGSSLKIIWL